MNSTLLDLGIIEIKWYSFFILSAILLATFLIIKETKRFNIKKDFTFNLIFWCVIFGLLGARLYYVLFNLNYYINNIGSIFKIWEGGLAIHGALISGAITVYIYCKKYSVNPFKMTDIMLVSILLGQAIGRWGNFFNQEAHGAITTKENLSSLPIPNFVIEGMNIEGIYYHPTFFYESMWCLIGFIILIFVRKYKNIKIGQLSCLYLIWYSLGRFFIEASRTDSLMIGNLKAAQLLSILLFILSSIVYFLLNRKTKFQILYNKQ